MNLVSSHSAIAMPGVHRGTGPNPFVQNQAATATVASAAGKPNATSDKPNASGDSTKTPDREQERELQLQARLRMKQAQEQRLVAEQIQILAARDREVRAHEQAHVAAGGQYAGAAAYQYERGPNGVSYAVSGEVAISTGEEATPEATLRKAQIIRRAALAPAEPSPQDRRVAAMASRLEVAARAEIAAARTREEEEAKAAEPADKTAVSTTQESSATVAGEPETQAGESSAASSRQPDDLARLQRKLFTRDKMASAPPGTLFSQMA